MQTVNERTSAKRPDTQRRRQFSPTTAFFITLPLAAGATYLLTLAVEALFSVQWWTILFHMVAFFTLAIMIFRRLCPQAPRLLLSGVQRFLDDSGALDVIWAARRRRG